VSVTPSTIAVLPGSSGRFHLAVTPLNGFNGTVTITLSGLPPGVAASPSSPFTLGGTSQDVTLSVGSSVALADYALTFQAASGPLSRSANATLQVAALASFSVFINANELGVRIGSSGSTVVGTSVGGGVQNYEVGMSVAGLPTGVTAIFAQNPITVGTSTTLTIFTTSQTPLATNMPITVIATRLLDSAQQTGHFILDVVPNPGTLPNSRSDFLRLDTTPTAAVYDAARKRAFVTNRDLSSIDVVSANPPSLVARIPVSSPLGLDLSLDGKEVLVANGTNQIVFVDSSTLQVSRRVILPKMPLQAGSPQFVAANQLRVTANGTILLKVSSPFYSGGAQWDPAKGTVIARNDSGLLGGGFMVRSADGSRILISDVDTGGAVTAYDAASDKFTTAVLSSGNFVFALAANPTGTQFVAAVDLVGILVLDQNLRTIGRVPAGGLTTGLLYSLDGNFLYVVSEPDATAEISTVDMRTLALVGTAPAYATNIAYIRRVPPLVIETPLAVDETGLIFGSADRGLALDDSTDFHNFPTSTATPIFTIIADPAEGPLSGGTAVTIRTQGFNLPPDIWFGSRRGTNITLNGSFAQATTPAASVPGPVNVKLIQADGHVSYVPQGFTNGAQLLNTGDLAGSSAGGATIDLFGYGFGVDVQGAPISVAINGNNAPIGFKGIFPAELNNPGYPFPLQHLKVTVPSGNPGSQDITVTTPWGSATLPRGFHYPRSFTDYASSDTFSYVLYDRFRDHLYLSTADHVDVFSLGSKSFLSPVTLPNLNGKSQPTGLALTLDGSRLLVANQADRSVAILDPDNPSTAKATQVNGPSQNPNCSPGPGSLFPTSKGTVFISIFDSANFGCTNRGLRELDLNTLAVTDRLDVALITSGVSLSGSRDGKRAFLVDVTNDGGSVHAWDASLDMWMSHQTGGQLFDSGVAADGNLFAARGVANALSDGIRIIDPNLNVVSRRSQQEFLPFGTDHVSNLKLHDSGSLIYAPIKEGLDIIDTFHGDLRERIMLTEQLSFVTRDALAIDQTGARIFLITSAGLTVIELDAVPLSLGSVAPSSGPATGGTTLTLRGSGFQQGTTVALGGVSVSAVFVDANTLRVIAPQLPSGSARITLQNPDGSSYSLDAVYTAQ
jgi:hypothetical protein